MNNFIIQTPVRVLGAILCNFRGSLAFQRLAPQDKNPTLVSNTGPLELQVYLVQTTSVRSQTEYYTFYKPAFCLQKHASLNRSTTADTRGTLTLWVEDLIEASRRSRYHPPRAPDADTVARRGFVTARSLTLMSKERSCDPES